MITTIKKPFYEKLLEIHIPKSFRLYKPFSSRGGAEAVIGSVSN
jgi:hypothetical protein